MLTALILTVAWFALGVSYAPRAAAHGYKTCPYRYEDMRKNSAKCWYWNTMIFGPVVILGLSFYNYVVQPLNRSGDSRLDRALIRRDEEYRKKYLEQQEYRIAQLERENTRLTKSVLDTVHHLD